VSSFALSSPHASVTKLAAIRADFPILHKPTSNGKRLVFLDSAASSQKPQAVIDRLVRYYSEENANIHRGVYELAEHATAAFESARKTLQRFINAPSSAELIWTRNTTEAINLVAQCWARTNLKPGDSIVLSASEHHSNLVPWQVVAAQTGAELRFIPVAPDGRYILDKLDALLDGAKLVALAQVSNTFGSFAPLEYIVPRAKAVGAVVLIDGAQSLPHLRVDVQALGVDFFVASAHKMCGPTGIGFLWGRRALLEAMPPFMTGGDMINRVTYTHTTYNELPWKFEAGTSNIADAVAFATALEYLDAVGMDWIAEHEQSLTKYALERLAALEPRGLRIIGPTDMRERGGVVSFTFADIHPHDIASLLSTEGVCVRAGNHCTMPLMESMGLSATARASFYLYNGEDDVDVLIDALEKAARIFKI
jgi:cysteine desulfurase/selenocysteine lyase